MKAHDAILVLLATSLLFGAEAAATDARESDPRLQQSTETEQLIREVGDAVFSRPFHFVRLLTGVAVLPVALPIAAVFADWRDGLDICVTEPWAMTFERPLGE